MAARSLVLLAAGLVGLAAGAGAHAAEVTYAPTVHVNYADLNLANDAGVTRLYARLRWAAKQVCEFSVMPTHSESNCTVHALDQAVATVGSERLNELHQQGRQAATGA